MCSDRYAILDLTHRLVLRLRRVESACRCSIHGVASHNGWADSGFASARGSRRQPAEESLRPWFSWVCEGGSPDNPAICRTSASFSAVLLRNSLPAGQGIGFKPEPRQHATQHAENSSRPYYQRDIGRIPSPCRRRTVVKRGKNANVLSSVREHVRKWRRTLRDAINRLCCAGTNSLFSAVLQGFRRKTGRFTLATALEAANRRRISVAQRRIPYSP